jgi:hypothetical protein
MSVFTLKIKAYSVFDDRLNLNKVGFEIYIFENRNEARMKQK